MWWQRGQQQLQNQIQTTEIRPELTHQQHQQSSVASAESAESAAVPVSAAKSKIVSQSYAVAEVEWPRPPSVLFVRLTPPEVLLCLGLLV